MSVTIRIELGVVEIAVLKRATRSAPCTAVPTFDFRAQNSPVRAVDVAVSANTAVDVRVGHHHRTRVDVDTSRQKIAVLHSEGATVDI